MEKAIYKLFGKVLESNKPKVPFSKMIKLSFRLGLFVPENLCYKWLYDVLTEQQINPNSTFYQSWNDIISKTRFELFVDQIKHYISTYGTDFQGEAWIPERTSELPEFPYKELKVVESITKDELKEEITKLAYSNIAMTADTLTTIVDVVREYNIPLDIEQIKIRELKLRLIPDNYKFKDGQECLLWILWKWYGYSMLVKNKETLDTLHGESKMLPVLNLNQEILASVFYRNKDVFMRFKQCEKLRHIINVIRKLATKLHKPMKKSPWLRLEELSLEERIKLFNDTPIFKLVQMYNVLYNPTGYYVIRNGKAFYKESTVRNISPEILDELLATIVNKVPKVDAVALPKGIELAMPTSEKNFIGEIPLGSYVNCAEKNTMIGIYWRNEWGAHDLDLHVATIDGNNIGWNAGFYDDGETPFDIVFSGDMTNANPEAAEVMWFKKQPKDSIVSVSEYNGKQNYSYEMFIAQEKATNFKENYMVDPTNIIFKTKMELSNKDVTLGYFKDGRFIFHSCSVGNGQVPSAWRTKILEHLTQCTYLTVSDVLDLAGIKISDDAEIKLTSKVDLINFFSIS